MLVFLVTVPSGRFLLLLLTSQTQVKQKYLNPFLLHNFYEWHYECSNLIILKSWYHFFPSAFPLISVSNQLSDLPLPLPQILTTSRFDSYKKSIPGFLGSSLLEQSGGKSSHFNGSLTWVRILFPPLTGVLIHFRFSFSIDKMGICLFQSDGWVMR